MSIETWSTVNIAFRHPFSLIVSGVSYSGKSTAVSKLLLERQKFISDLPPTTCVVYFHKHDDPNMFARLREDPCITFVQHCPSIGWVNDWFEEKTEGTHVVFVVDDFMSELAKDAFLVDSFTTFRHRNASVIFLTQNIFLNTDIYRTASLNAKHFWIFRNDRNKAQMAHFFRQLEPGKSKALLAAFDAATQEPFSFLWVYLFTQNRQWRYKSHLFDENHPVVIYRL